MNQKKFSEYKNIRFIILIVIVFSLCLLSCNIRKPLPDYDKKRNCYPIEIGDGPEDFVLDRWHTVPRLLISSHERREPARYGDIYSFDLDTGYSEKMTRTGEPDKLASFKPHGMDIRHADGKTFLYVILHDPYNKSVRDENGIAIYQVLDRKLNFIEMLEDITFLWSPNDISVLESGEIYASNDYRSEFDIYLRKKTSEIAYYSVQEKKWSAVARDISFANGILAMPDRVYVAATRSDRLIEYPRKSNGSLGKGKVLLEMKGLDNIMPFGKRLVVAAHFNDWAFFWHHKDSKNLSPSVVFLIDPDSSAPDETKKVIYADEGGQISAASTAFIYENKLYISQVFESKILVCDAVDLKMLNE